MMVFHCSLRATETREATDSDIILHKSDINVTHSVSIQEQLSKCYILKINTLRLKFNFMNIEPAVSIFRQTIILVLRNCETARIQAD